MATQASDATAGRYPGYNTPRRLRGPRRRPIVVAPESRPARALAAAGALVLVLGAVVMALHFGRYPPRLPGRLFPPEGAGLRSAKLADMTRILGWLLAMNLAAWSLGVLVERLLRCRSAGKEFRLLHRLGFGFALLSLLVLGLAALHALEFPAVHLAIALPAAAAVAIAWTRRGRPWIGERPHGRLSWLALAAVLLCLNAFLGAFAPEPGWDALTYHLAIPERYLFANGIVVTPFSHLTAYPFLMEMLYVPALVLGGPSLATLLHFEFGALLLAAVSLAANRFSRLAAILAPAVLLADPLFQRELSWAYNDLTLAFYAFLALVAFEERSASSDRGSLRYAGVLSGICLLVKLHGALVLAALLLMLWLPPRRRVRATLLAGGVLAGWAVVVCSPWLVRNLVFTGNPVAPLLQSLFYPAGGEYFDRTAIEQSTTFLSRVGMGRSLGALLLLPWNLVMRTVPEVYGNSFGYQVTPLYVIGALGALLVGSVRRHPLVARLLAAGGILTVLWFFTFQEARFLLPALACFAVAGGAALAALASGLPGWGRLFIALPLAGLVYCQALLLEELPARYGYAIGTLSVEEFRNGHPAEAAAVELRKVMGPRDRLLLFAESRGFIFRGLDYIPYHINEGAQVLQWIHRQKNLDELHCALREQGVTYLLINVEHLHGFLPTLVPSYGLEEFEGDLALVQAFAKTRAKTVFARDGIWAGVLLDPPKCPP
ncbi:MAG: hypothetical protein LAO51_00315 [Acidobacteriia bacterium]|nr:hypothetical protein [Terriglobia bacterium]